MIPLFERFPRLKDKLPYVSLCQLPTPIIKLDRLGSTIGLDHLYIKQDGLTAQPFGGNKIRKLEFLLGEALDQGAKEVMTFGFAGSNHALATAVYAKKIGLTGISMLMPQHNAHYVRRNLLMSHYCNTELHQYPNKLLLKIGTMVQRFRHRLKKGKVPYIIPTGGSTPLGALGFVNAAFELKDQVERKEIPEPHRIYVALGSAGTLVGLMIGLKALNIKSKVIPVRVVDHHFTTPHTVLELFSKTSALLHAKDSSFPLLELTGLESRDQYLGNGYAQFTEPGKQAIALVEETEGIRLDGTYTGKTFAALIDDAREQKIKDQVVLFWNTLNARDLSGFIKDMDYHQLPKSFHRYFEQDVQPLDT
ncbi:MAG: pyridoxal-phosphate dependent enzyme [Candidatus Aminicenantes bacterium]|nr:MAG: pyridoxal-phosphate dependent enzyme [Candidatus Aminicenantes bacterium]